jgi:LCP family protein required for cell wall assembly
LHARRVAAATRTSRVPATGLTDRRRLTAAGLSALLPGLGQLYNGRRTLGIRFLVPSLIVIGFALAVWWVTPPTRLAATIIVPSTLLTVLVLNLLVLAWRLVAVGQGFFDGRFTVAPGRVGFIGLALIVAFVAIPHAMAGYVGWIAYGTFERVFSGPIGQSPDRGAPTAPAPASNERLNVLLTGVDTGPGRNHALTDTMILVSLDPVGETVTMISVPRDMVDVPLGDGNVFGPKLNSLQSYAASHPDEFEDGGSGALSKAIGALLGVPVHYTAEVDLAGFVSMIDAVGGVDVTVAKPLADPNYGGFGVGPGWSIKPGDHHLDGAEALAYARIRKSAGESDFTRAGRQQQVLLALRDAAVSEDLLFSLPRLLGAVGDTIRTDLPPSRLPELAALAEAVDGKDATLVVIKHPLVRSGGRNHRYGSVQVPDVAAIQAMAKLALPKPGVAPTPWPTPKPTKAPAPSPSP